MVLRPVSGRLDDIDAVCLRLFLEFEDAFDLDWTHLLRLRREVYQTGRMLLEMDPERHDSLRQLLYPPAPTDTRMRRLAPVTPSPFVLQMRQPTWQHLEPGDVLPLDFLLIGRGRFLAHSFITLVGALGNRGLFHDHGRFALVQASAVDPDGRETSVWRADTPWREPAWPLFRLWSADVPLRPITLEFLTPARILSRGKPLFRPDLRHLVMAMTRRVSSLVYSWCDVDLFDNVRDYLNELPDTSPQGDLVWQDWRTLEGEMRSQALGGVTGRVTVPTEWMMAAGAVIQLCRWFNVGKGAAFGAGCFLLRDEIPPSVA